MALLTKDQIINAEDLPRELVEVPEWGGEVYVRALTAEERDDYESSMIRFVHKGKREEREYNMKNMKARLAVRCIVGEDGKRIFADGDVVFLGRKSAGALNRVIEVCQRLSGMTDEEKKEIEGNLEATPGDASASDLH